MFYSAGFKSLGYSFVEGYIEKNTIRTDAPNQVVFDIIKAWVISIFLIEEKNPS